MMDIRRMLGICGLMKAFSAGVHLSSVSDGVSHIRLYLFAQVLADAVINGPAIRFCKVHLSRDLPKGKFIRGAQFKNLALAVR